VVLGHERTGDPSGRLFEPGVPHYFAKFCHFTLRTMFELKKQIKTKKANK
jgi:hypothetical protein